MLHSRGILKTPYPSFSPHWTNPSLQPPRMALSSESPSTPPLLLLRVPTVSPFLEMKCLPRPSPALVYTSLRPGSGLMMKECIISEPTAPWHLPVTSSEGPRTVAPLPLPRPPGHLGGGRSSPELPCAPHSLPRPRPHRAPSQSRPVLQACVRPATLPAILNTISKLLCILSPSPLIMRHLPPGCAPWSPCTLSMGLSSPTSVPLGQEVG